MTTATSSRSSGSSRTKQQQRSRQATKARTRQTTSKESTSKGTSGSSQATTSRTSRSRGQQSHGTTVDLPFVTAEFHRPDLRLPTGNDVASVANTVRAQLPSREQAVFYGALTLGTAFAMIEWPVALAIGVGTALAQHESRKTE